MGSGKGRRYLEVDSEVWFLRHESGREVTVVAMPNEKLYDMMQLGYVDISFDGYKYQPIEEYLEPEAYRKNAVYSVERTFLFRPETLNVLRDLKRHSKNYFNSEKELTYHEILDMAIRQLAENLKTTSGE